MLQCEEHKLKKRQLSNRLYYRNKSKKQKSMNEEASVSKNPVSAFKKDAKETVVNRVEGVMTNLTIRLTGEAQKFQRTKQGIYILQPNYINGKKYWLQPGGPNAIWYDKENPDQGWNIGPIGNLGSSIASIVSEDSIGPLEATTWKYHDVMDDEFIEASNQITLSAGISLF